MGKALPVIGAVVGAVLGFFVGHPFMGAGLGYSVGMAMSPQPELDQDLGGSVTRYAFSELTNTFSNQGIVPLVYGNMMVAGNFIWQSEPGETTKFLLVLCEGEVDDIYAVAANDIGMGPGTTLTAGKMIVASDATPLEYQTEPLDVAEACSYIVFPEYRMDPDAADFELRKANGDALSTAYYTIHYQESFVSWKWPDQLAAELAEAGGYFTANYTATTFENSTYDAYKGTKDQTVDARVTGIVMGLRYTAYLALTLAASRTLSGSPKITAMVKGLKVRTWDTDHWTGTLSYSNNPAAVLRDYLTRPYERGGCGKAEIIIDDASFGEAYGICAEEIDSGAAGNVARYMIGIVIDKRASALDNINDICAVAGMGLVKSGSSYKLIVETDSDTSVQTFDEDLIGKDSFKWAYAKNEEKPNRAIVEWTDPTKSKNFKRQAIAEDESDQELRGIVEGSMYIKGITNVSQALRMAKRFLYEMKLNSIGIEFIANVQAIHCEPGDIIKVTHSRPNWTEKQFRILNMEEGTFGKIVIRARPYNASILDDSYGARISGWNQQDNPPNTKASIGDVTNVAGAESSYTDKDGRFQSNIDVTWTALATNREYLHHHIIELKKTAGGSYAAIGVAPAEAIAFTIWNVEANSVSYWVRIKTVSIFGIVSSGAASAEIIVLGQLTPPADVTGFANTFTNEIKFTWNKNTEADLIGYEIRTADSNWGTQNAALVFRGLANTFTIVTPASRTPGAHYIKAYNRSGIYSTNAASTTPTNAAPAAPTISSTQWFGFAKIEWSDSADTDLLYYEVYKSATNAWAGEEVLECRVSGSEAIVQGKAPVDCSADSADATSITDDALIGKGVDYFVGDRILQTSGTYSGQVATVTAFNNTTGQVSVASWPSGTPTAADKFVLKDRAHFKVRGVDTYGVGSFSSATTIDFTPLAEAEIGDAIISARKLIAGEVITLSAQIKDAIITNAKILTLAAEKIEAGSIIVALDMDSLARIKNVEGATYPYIQLSGDGLQLKDSDTGGTYGTAKYGTDKYGFGALAWILNPALKIPFAVLKEVNAGASDVADIRLYNRSDTPGGPAEIGDICCVNGKLMQCTGAGTPGTWVVTGSQTA